MNSAFITLRKLGWFVRFVRIGRNGFGLLPRLLLRLIFKLRFGRRLLFRAVRIEQTQVESAFFGLFTTGGACAFEFGDTGAHDRGGEGDPARRLAVIRPF